MQHLEYLPKYDYVGPDAQAPGVADAANAYFRQAELQVNAPEVHDPMYEQQFTALEDTLWDLGSDLGLDLGARLRGNDHIHLYTPESYEAVREQFGRSEVSVAVHSTSGHILAVQEATPMATLGNVNHELVHVMSRKSIRPALEAREEGYALGVPRSHDGFESARHGTYNGLNEIMTEATNIDLMRNYWPNYSALSEVTRDPYDNVGYASGLILFDELLKVHFDDPRAAFKQLQRAMFTGDMGELRVLADVLGAETARKLATFDVNDPEGVAQLAEGLSLDGAARKIRSNDTNQLFDWLKATRW